MVLFLVAFYKQTALKVGDLAKIMVQKVVKKWSKSGQKTGKIDEK